MANPVGRPSLYDSKYCDELIAHMALGFSFESFAGKIDVAEATINNWQNEHEEFLEAHQIGKSKMRVFWEELGIVGTTEGKNFNASAWKFNMQNKLKWKERVDQTTNDKDLPTPIYGGKSTETV
jgi:hypothetical protein